MIIIFFERTAQDSACFIDIEEKYKTTTLGSYRQGTKRKEKKKKTTRPVGLWHQHGKHSPVGWIGTSTTTTLSHITIHHNRREEDASAVLWNLRFSAAPTSDACHAALAGLAIHRTLLPVPPHTAYTRPERSLPAARPYAVGAHRRSATPHSQGK
jgi:hypothetical protein